MRGLVNGNSKTTGHSDPTHGDETASRHSSSEGQGDRCTGSCNACATPAQERARNHAAHGSRSRLGDQRAATRRAPVGIGRYAVVSALTQTGVGHRGLDVVIRLFHVCCSPQPSTNVAGGMLTASH